MNDKDDEQPANTTSTPPPEAVEPSVPEPDSSPVVSPSEGEAVEPAEPSAPSDLRGTAPPQIEATAAYPPLPLLDPPAPRAETPTVPPPVISLPPKPKRATHWVRRIVIVLALIFFVFPPVLTLIYKVVPPPLTILMVERMIQGQGFDRQWRGLSDIAPALPQAVIAAEDARFCSHHGFDFEAMRKAALHNERQPGKVRGGSTLSQQTAKNVFLWPSRDYVRKGLEAYFTVLEEAIWGKRRIIETYLNVVEWGPGTYGAQAASQRYFHKDARDLSGAEAARLAAILPSPLKWKAVNPGRYVQRRSARIDAAEGTVRDDDLAWCVRR